MVNATFNRWDVQELERGLDTMLDAYGNNAGQEHEDVQGPSAPQPAAAKKKPQRPSKKPRAAASAHTNAGLMPTCPVCPPLIVQNCSLTWKLSEIVDCVTLQPVGLMRELAGTLQPLQQDMLPEEAQLDKLIAHDSSPIDLQH